MRINIDSGRVLWRRHVVLPDSLDTDATHGFWVYPLGGDLLQVLLRRRGSGAVSFLARVTTAGETIWANTASAPRITSATYIGRHVDVTPSGRIFVRNGAGNVVEVDPADGSVLGTVKSGASEYLICVGETPVDTNYATMCVESGNIVVGNGDLTSAGGKIFRVDTDGTTIVSEIDNPAAIYAAVPYAGGFFVASHRTPSGGTTDRLGIVDGDFEFTWVSPRGCLTSNVATDGNALFAGGAELAFDFDSLELGQILALSGEDQSGLWIRSWAREAFGSPTAGIKVNGLCVLGDSLYATGWDGT